MPTTECSAGRCVDGEERREHDERKSFTVSWSFSRESAHLGNFRYGRWAGPGVGKLQQRSIAASSRHPTPADRQNNGIHKVRAHTYAATLRVGGIPGIRKGVGRGGQAGCRTGGLDDGALHLAIGRPWLDSATSSSICSALSRSTLLWPLKFNLLTGILEISDSTRRAVSLATSAPSATLPPTLPSSRSRVSRPRRMPSSTLARYVLREILSATSRRTGV